MRHLLRSTLIGAALAACYCLPAVSGTEAATPVNWPVVTSPVPRDPAIEARIRQLLGKLSVEQKIAQMVQADIRHATPEEVRQYRLGSILNGGGRYPDNNKHAAI